MHRDLPRAAPGSTETTRLLLRLAGPLPDHPWVLDLGADAGRAGLVLAADTGGLLLALGPRLPVMTRLGTAAAAADLRDRVHPVVGAPQALPLPDAAVDLLWAEGSPFGFDAALVGWRRVLRPNGTLVLTELEWTTSQPAAQARSFWAERHPAMRAAADNVRAAQAAGWSVRPATCCRIGLGGLSRPAGRAHRTVARAWHRLAPGLAARRPGDRNPTTARP